MTGKLELRELTSYDEDFLLWSEEQAEMLRRRAATRPEAFTGLDIEHLVEEIADLGGALLQAAKSYLTQLFAHLIKAASDPAALSLHHWLTEVRGYQIHLENAYVPSMRQRIDLESVWEKARMRAVRDLELFGKPIGSEVPRRCPFTLDELLSEDIDVVEAVARLGGSLPLPARAKSP